MRELRQNSYGDFIAVTEDLVKSGFVKPKQIGVFGLSNGGLLAATIGLQRPDLFGRRRKRCTLDRYAAFSKHGNGLCLDR
jgi:prolyl oligopeptidase PreP (S9A serine peptidase family)